MEDAPRVRPRARAVAACLRALGLALGLELAIAAVAAEDPVAELTEALRRLGPPGVLWGRLAVEEESPDGAWTPLAGVEIHLFPAAPALVAELERLRQSARDSGRQYDTAIARLQATLAAYQTHLETASHAPPGATRRITDPAGLFLFDALPSGEWLLVAVRVTPYSAGPSRPEVRRRPSPRAPQFLPKAAEPVKDAEVWLTRVRVGSGERVAVVLTDRARWLVGPAR